MKKKKKMVPPKSIAVKAKERNEIYIYIYIYIKSKDKNKHEAIGWERDLRSQGENAINLKMVKMVKRIFK